VLLASLSLVMALPAAASDEVAAKSVTIRVLVVPVTQTVKDVPPKTISVGKFTKGDTIWRTAIFETPCRSSVNRKAPVSVRAVA